MTDPGACRSTCCGPTRGVPVFGGALYDRTLRAEVPDAAVLASLGSGNPLAVADLRPGEVILDLGSGGGLDVLLAARRVGPGGRPYGLDMTDEMLALARGNARRAGPGSVEFLKGCIEDIPLPSSSVDVVTSNCDGAAIVRARRSSGPTDGTAPGSLRVRGGLGRAPGR